MSLNKQQRLCIFIYFNSTSDSQQASTWIIERHYTSNPLCRPSFTPTKTAEYDREGIRPCADIHSQSCIIKQKEIHARNQIQEMNRLLVGRLLGKSSPRMISRPSESLKP